MTWVQRAAQGRLGGQVFRFLSFGPGLRAGCIGPQLFCPGTPVPGWPAALPSKARKLSGLGGDGWGHWQRHQGELPHSGPCSTASGVSEAQDWGHLYSPHATEHQEQQYLHYIALERAVETAAAEDTQAVETADALSSDGEVAAAAATAADKEAEGRCDECGHSPEDADFYDSDYFDPDRQLVLRSSWLCAGAGSLAAMRERLEERIRFLADLEADGWQLEATVEDELVCLHNAQPKPLAERRLAEAWEIVE